MRVLFPILTGVFLVSVLVGCNNGNKQQRTNDQADTTPRNDATATKLATAQPVTQSAARSPNQDGPQPLADPLRGKVKETMDAGGYTYVLLASADREVWAAAKQFPVAVGNEVELAGLMPMRDFHSRALDRTFEEIQFVGRAAVVGENAATSAVAPHQSSPMQGMPAGHPPISGVGKPANAAPVASGTVEKVEAIVDGITVAALFAKKADLQGKLVKFRGRVVKANSGILGKNWLHIQDGTGEQGTNDITVTSPTGIAPVGSTVVIEGTLALDRDFGAGYVYAVIVENAKVTVESE